MMGQIPVSPGQTAPGTQQQAKLGKQGPPPRVTFPLLAQRWSCGLDPGPFVLLATWFRLSPDLSFPGCG